MNKNEINASDTPYTGPRIDNKIGIGIVIDQFDEYSKITLSEIERFSPKNAVIVIVENATHERLTNSSFHFQQKVSLSTAVKKCVEILCKNNCEHLFLFDDVSFPIINDWFSKYITHEQQLLFYISKDYLGHRNENNVYNDEKTKVWTKPKSSMVYLHRKLSYVFDRVDNVIFDYETLYRAVAKKLYNEGKINFQIMDIADSTGLFFSYNDFSSRNPRDRTIVPSAYHQKPSLIIHQESANTKQPDRKLNLFITAYFNKIDDPQRTNTRFPNDNYLLQPLINSISNTQLVILHDCLNADDSQNVSYKLVQTSINPYFQRWICYYEYLLENKHCIDQVFCIDATDVEILNNPFDYNLETFIWTGDEPGLLGDPWLREYHRSPLFNDYFIKFQKLPLLNAGILGGKIHLVLSFIKEIIDFYFQAQMIALDNPELPSAGLTDMGAFNFIAYSRFSKYLKHGPQVNTKFKAYERNSYSWFKHK